MFGPPARQPCRRGTIAATGAAALALVVLLAALAGCSTPGASGPSVSAKPSSTMVGSAKTAEARDAATLASTATAATDASSPDGGSAAAPAPTISAQQAKRILFLDSPDAAIETCPTAPEADRIRCMIGVRYKEDQTAAQVATELYEQTGSVAGLENGHIMDGGWRGTIRIVPELPVRHFRRHLEWVAGGLQKIDVFFRTLQERANKPLPYRWRPLALRYFRSVGRTTPSGYADDWTVCYNVSGSLHSSADAVRETMFHELFHLNDHQHGNWSHKKLSAIFDAIVARCTRRPGALPSSLCLKPYAPNHTMVRGGTYYAFHPGNGVAEYAAELAVRYYREHLAALGLGPGRSKDKPFKCGPEENRRSWRLLVDEFFAGVDLAPACP